MKIVSLNIEGQKHLERVREFLAKENVDVVCLQEVIKTDVETLLERHKYRVFGAEIKTNAGIKGVVIAGKTPWEEERVWYADGISGSEVPEEELGNHRPVVVEVQNTQIRLATTHFTWTPEMSETEKQNADLERLLTKMNGEELILCGDFNIPRGNSAYKRLAKVYKDNIPSSVTTTIDFDLHRAKREGKARFEVVVDYIWSTPKYQVSNVRVVSGISDHCGVVGEVV